MVSSTIVQAASCYCCTQGKFFEVDNGCVRAGTTGEGANVFYGGGVHVFFGLGYEFGATSRVAESGAIINGTRGIVTVQQGYVGFAMKKGEPIILPPGLHQWDDADVRFYSMIDLSTSCITMGPYTLVTVEEGYAAITQDNGKQNVLSGGASYMLTHQNWKFQAWLSLKMQTSRTPALKMTTGDNIELIIYANVNWLIKDAVLAAGKNVDLKESGDGDTLALMRGDVLLQVMSSLAVLVGNIFYGSQGTEKPARTNETDSGEQGGEGSAPTPEEPELKGKFSRKALWDPNHLQSAVNHSNGICSRYGVDIFSINLIAATPADPKLVEIMSRGAVATVSAEETAKTARANANATLISAQAEAQSAQAYAEVEKIKAKAEADATTIAAQGEAARAQIKADALLVGARAEAEALKIKAEAEAAAERIRADGAKIAGLAIGESEVATSLAKLKVAYGPFAENQSSTFFFGLQGPGELPQAIMGSHLAKQTGVAGLAIT